MSILLGLYEEESQSTEKAEDDDLLMFGYACKLYKDEVKALLEDSGQLLIPWMGDGSLMIDRYDVRNRLEDKSRFGLKPSLPWRLTAAEEELEEQLEHERYLALACQEELSDSELTEEQKRQQSKDSLHAVGFSYGGEATPPGPTPLEHPPTSSVDLNEDDPFIIPDGLVIPEDISVPTTAKLHSIIERTAVFVAQQGSQMEIVIKTKQKFNPFFSFLDYNDKLYSYYKHVKQAVASGQYAPQSSASPEQGDKEEEEEEEEGGKRRDPEGAEAGREDGGGGSGEEVEGSCSDDDNDSAASDSEDGTGFELHPLLRGAVVATASKSPKKDRKKEKNALKEDDSKIRTSDKLFFAKRLAVNSAPSTEVATNGIYYQHYGGPYQGATDTHGYYGNTPDGYPGHYDYQAYYQALSASHISSVGPTPPPPNLQPIVDKTAEYVARNSDGFERTILQKHCDDPKFNFLNPWSEYHSYYQARKMHCRERIAQEQREKESYLNSLPNVQRLGSSGAVSFKLEPKSSRVVSTGEVVDLGIGEEVEDEGERRSGEGGEEPPAAKRQCLDTCEGGDSGEGGEGEVVKEDKIGNKVQEFLSTVKAMFGTESDST